MNKHKIVFNIFKDKMLFIFKRYKYNNNKISISKNLSFLSIISFIIIRSFKFIAKNESNENNFDMSSLKNILNKKKITSTLKTFKKIKIKKFDFIDIAKIDASIYYYLIYNKKNKFFFLMINKIYNTLYKSPLSKML